MSAYQALVNLSVPRKGDPGKETDLVMAGETVDLTDDVADLFRPPNRAMAMIRPAAEADPLPKIHPRQLSGIKVNPRTGKLIGVPGPGADARADPEGSSQVIITEPPEANEPQLDSENQLPVDAVDIQPNRGSRRAPARAGAK